MKRPHMWIEVILAKDDLAKVMADFCPLKIEVGKHGSILLTEPRGLELIAGVGLRMSVTAEVEWRVLGIPIPVFARTATLEVLPEIRKRGGADHLRFSLRLADLDLSLLPAVVEHGVLDLANAELGAEHMGLSWGFTKTLSHVFKLPEALSSARAIDVRAAWGQVKITSEALVLAVSFGVTVEPRRGGPSSSPAPPRPGVALATHKETSVKPRLIHGVWRPSATRVLVMGAAAWLAALAVSAIVVAHRPQPLFDT
jgi:hypothetical protein